MNDQNKQATLEVVIERIDNMGEKLGEAMGELKDAVRQVASAMNQIAALNERIENHRQHHDKGLERAFGAMEEMEDRINKRVDDHEGRMRTVEGKMPTIALTSGWVLSIAGLVGIAVLAAALKILFGWG